MKNYFKITIISVVILLLGISFVSAGTYINTFQGGTGKGSWTQYAIPYMSGTTTFGEIAVGTVGQYLKVNAGATGYEWGSAGGGDVLSVGDCADGACFDGSADGGTYLYIYDGDSNYTSLVSSNVAETIAITLPATAGTLVIQGGTGGLDWTASSGTIHTDNYVENVSTALSIGTTNANTVAITSDGGADDVVIPAAINGTAGLLTDAKWDEIVANTGKTTNATHTGEVTGSGALTIADNITVTGWTMGASTATTPAANDNDTSLATSAFVQTELDNEVRSKSLVILNPVATDDYPVWKSPVAITITAVHVQCLGGTNIIGQLTECDAEGINCAVCDDADITATANNSVDDDGTLSNPSIDALDYVGWKTESISGTPTSVTVTFEYTIN